MQVSPQTQMIIDNLNAFVWFTATHVILLELIMVVALCVVCVGAYKTYFPSTSHASRGVKRGNQYQTKQRPQRRTRRVYTEPITDQSVSHEYGNIVYYGREEGIRATVGSIPSRDVR